MIETIVALEQLNYCGMHGLLRALRDGLINKSEYEQIKEYAHNIVGIPRDWWKLLVWSC